MTIQPYSGSAVVLCLTAADLRERRISPADPDPAATRRLLRELGLPLPNRTRVEAFALEGALLLFIRWPRRPRHYNSIT